MDIGIAWVLPQRLLERLLRPCIVSPQDVGKPLVVEDFRGLADDLDCLLIGAIREVEAPQPVVRCRQTHPGLGVTRVLFDGGTEILLGKTEIVVAKISFAALQIVIGIIA